MDRAEALKYEYAIRCNLTNGIHKEACDIAFNALREQDALARNSHDVASYKQVTEPLRPNGFDGHQQAIATKKQVKTCWLISAQERLPEEKVDVLMYFKEGNMAVGYLCDRDEHLTFWCAYTDGGYYTDCDSEPTHWMPLPEPPKD